MSGVRRRVGARSASSSIGQCKRGCNLGDDPRQSLDMQYLWSCLYRGASSASQAYTVESTSSSLTIHSLVTPLVRKWSDLAQRPRTYKSLERRSNMLESREGTSSIRELSASMPEAVDEITNASAEPTTTTATENREMQNRTSPERATDKRFVQRHANAMKARAGHRRNIRRSNTNG
jgi:hypothetical protein